MNKLLCLLKLVVVIAFFISPVLAMAERDDTTSNRNRNRRSAQEDPWPVDCPDCTPYSRGQRGNLQGGRRISQREIVEHVQALLHYFPPNFIDPRVAVCIAAKESNYYSQAINGGSTARGLYQVLRGTGAAALQERPCRGVMPYNWSTMAVSTRAQTFMFLCVAYMKVRESGQSSFNSVAVKRYHGNKSNSVNQTYLQSVRNKGCSGII